ncbi:uncharacterized protein J4E87_003458 [Alternaria ethzedia]|uniref:uncharacterized protein n=1 Tax=Alternaria ethzedia TaxID=181014 RepID=UPI0020C1EDD2|nr:uncharacterized protein J4E87_003458 [Alternaria ethzedia]KAI4629196.1 hypothetical protein J4E87_003458 [Alternaria ethzedia]
MARTKREARRAPNSIAQHRRDIAAYYAGLVQDKNTPARRHALAYSSLPEETPIPVGFMGQVIKEAQKSPQTRELDEFNRLVAARLENRETSVERALLNLLLDREAKIEQEKLEQAAATEAKKQQWVLDGQRRHQGILSAGGDPVWTRRHLNRAFLGYGDKSDSDSDSVLSPSESDIDDPDSGRIRKDPPVAGKQPAVGDTSTPTPEVVKEEAKTKIADAISTLTFEKGSDCPLWIGHLEKPLPHPSLTPLQNEHVLKRLYHDEIARLSALRDTRGPPAGHPPGGDWMYTSLYGETKQVKEEAAGSHRAAARGWWTYSVDGEDLEEVWEKWPVGLDGTPVGWRRVNWKDGTVGTSLVRNWLERELWAMPEEDAMEGVEFE